MPYDTRLITGNGQRIGSLLAGAAMVAPLLAARSLGRLLLAAGGLALLQRGLTGRFALFPASAAEITPPAAAAVPRQTGQRDAVAAGARRGD